MKDLGIMVLSLITINILNLKIYEVMRTGYLDMEFKCEGIRQVTCML